MTTKQAILTLINSNEYHHAIGDLPHSALCVEAFNMAIKALNEIRPRGEWEVIGRETFSPTVTYRCSVCKAKEVSCIPNDKPHYCENCGADMRDGGTE